MYHYTTAGEAAGTADIKTLPDRIRSWVSARGFQSMEERISQYPRTKSIWGAITLS